jgi:hypothetical protein
MEQLIKGYYEFTYVGKDEEYEIYKIATHTIGCATMRLLLEEMQDKNLHAVFDFTNKRVLIAELPF